jgi:HPt (histidine-containing phosphotransfer) domain-containing protein
MTADGAPVFDPTVIADLRAATGDDDEFIADLIGSYLAEGRENVDALAAAASEGDLAVFARAAHTLKSTSATVGAMRLSELCRGLEEAARAGRDVDLVGEAEKLQAAWLVTTAALDAAGLSG